MTINLIPMISYVLISSFTPGPSNISSASLAVLHGYKNTLKYQAGLAFGVLLLMLLSGWLSTTLLSLFPELEPVLRYVGAGYILYLAWKILKATYTFTAKEAEPLGFIPGLLLQVLNPKLVVYAFTLFTAFLSPLTISLAPLVLACVLLAFVSFCSTSTWALCGTAIKTYLHNPRLTTIVNIALSLLLVYAALALVGIL
jgi:cysteine/O-acetylserine efflux protein